MVKGALDGSFKKLLPGGFNTFELYINKNDFLYLSHTFFGQITQLNSPLSVGATLKLISVPKQPDEHCVIYSIIWDLFTEV